MFETFETSLTLGAAGEQAGELWVDDRLVGIRGYREFAAKFGGCTFGNGIYRVHDASSGPIGLRTLREAFPEHAERAVPFSFDWLGRQFAVDLERLVAADPQILLLEPGTGQVLEIPCGFVAFHNEELVEFREAALAETFFDAWCGSDPASIPLEFDRCVGYRVPLFLGGADEIENLEVIDWDVYWAICGQLRRGTASLAPGTTIAKVARRASESVPQKKRRDC
jgi:hypothetical protein